MTTIYLIRHAEPYNPRHILYGRLPGFGLSDHGHDQADDLGRRLAPVDAARVYASPLLRARQTARLLAAHQVHADGVFTRAGLLEVHTSLEGRPLADMPPGFNYYEPPLRPDDETIEQQFIRMDAALRRIVKSHSDATVLAVSHGDPIASLRAGYRRRPFRLEEIRQADYPDLLSITLLTYENEQAWPTMSMPGQPRLS